VQRRQQFESLPDQLFLLARTLVAQQVSPAALPDKRRHALRAATRNDCARALYSERYYDHKAAIHTAVEQAFFI
jgi:hypothetical protein